MHWRYYPLQVNVPKNTTAASPVASTFPIVQGHLKKIEILVPAGHHGQTGLRITYFGVQIYPWGIAESWLVDSGNLRCVEWDDEIEATGLVVQAYNTDLTAHAFYLLAEVLPVLGAAEAAYGGSLEAPRTARVRAQVAQLGRRRAEAA
jgi:hypothetical protein